MTTQDQPADDTIRRLRRRTSDRVIGGVAGGLGDYLNVDPLLIRIGFVGLMVFGGAGLVLYVIAWLLIPSETSDRSIVESVARAVFLRPPLWIAVLLVLLVLAWSILATAGGQYDMQIQPALFWGIAVFVLVVLLLQRDDGSSQDSGAERSRASSLRGMAWHRFAWVAIVGVIILALLSIGNGDFDGGLYIGGLFVPPLLVWGLIVLTIAVLLLSRDPSQAVTPPQPLAADGPNQPGPTAPSGSVTPLAEPASQAPPRAAVPPKPRGPLGWYTLAAILITTGLVAVLQNLASLRVLPGQYLGLALLLLGIGLAIGAWWGSARPLILLGILLLPLGVAASFLTAPIQGGFGDQTFTPRTLPDVQREYRMAGGRLVVDLSQLDADATVPPLSASVGMGQLTVIVPANHAVDATVSVGGGATGFFDEWTGGTDLANHYQRAGAGSKLVLMLEAGIGEIRILSPDERGRCIGCDCSWWLSCGYSLADEEAY